MKKFINWYSGLNIYIALIPFLIFYLLICLVFTRDRPYDDKTKYLLYTKYILSGYYSPAPDIDLWAGRGYSVFLIPFILLKIPVMKLTFLNAFLLYFSLVIFNKTIGLYTLSKNISIYTILLGLYFPVYMSLPQLMTECLTWFLLTSVAYLLIKTIRAGVISWKSIALCGFFIAYLAMTKVIFGWVIILMIIISIAMLLIKRFKSAGKITAYVFSFSFILCVPYLLYTYSITGKTLYWTNCSGLSLYTMTAPYQKDYGDWKPVEEMAVNPNYKDFIHSITNLPPIERDLAFKKQAVANIKKYPAKYVMNCVANLGRLFFEYPHTNALQSSGTFFFLAPNMFAFVFIIMALAISIFYLKKIPVEIIVMLVFIMVYLAGSVFVSAYCRMFIVTLPFWMFFFFYVLHNISFTKKIRT
jgi:hypothetical protein